MTRILLTGGSGFLGREVVSRLLARGDKVYALVRDQGRCPEGAVPLVGDITQVRLGLEHIPLVDEFWHLAALLDLGEGRRRALLRVNLDGTFNALNVAEAAGATRFVLTSTAYVHGPSRNAYELSKKCAERYARERAEMTGFNLTVFRPSILVASAETRQPPRGQGFYRFAVMLGRVHRRVERMRRAVEDAVRLPELRPRFRLRGDGGTHLNLVPVDVVARAMVEIPGPGTFHLTNPEPPQLRELAQWVGEALSLEIRLVRRFRMAAPEALFHRLMAPFLVYLEKEIELPASDLCAQGSMVDREFVLETVTNALLG